MLLTALPQVGYMLKRMTQIMTDGIRLYADFPIQDRHLLFIIIQIEIEKIKYSKFT